MANWKREIRRLCKDFGFATEIYKKVITQTENNNKDIPQFYNGNKDAYYYDVAYNQIKPYIMQI